MINVLDPQEMWDAIKAGNQIYVRMDFTAQNIVVDETDIDSSGGITITDSMDSGSGKDSMSKICCKQLTASIFINDKTRSIRWKDRFRLDFGIKLINSDFTRWTTIGYFNGNTPTKTRNSTIVQFVAYDDMFRFDVDAKPFINYIKQMDYITLNDFTFSLCRFAGIDNVTINNAIRDYDVWMIERTFDPEKLDKFTTLREILEKIAEATCTNARMRGNYLCVEWYGNSQGNKMLTIDLTDEFDLEYVEPYDPLKWSDVSNHKWDRYKYTTWGNVTSENNGMIDCVRLIGDDWESEENSYAFYTEKNGLEFCSSIYTIEENPFLQGVTPDIARIFYERIVSIGNRLPLSLECVGDFNLEANDLVTIAIDGNTTKTIPICYKQFYFNGDCRDVIEVTETK